MLLFISGVVNDIINICAFCDIFFLEVMRMDSIGELLKRERKKSGLTQAQLAELLGVHRTLIGQYERGVRVPKAGTIQRIANALNIPYLQLIVPEQDLADSMETVRKDYIESSIEITHDSMIRVSSFVPISGLIAFLAENGYLEEKK